MVDHKIEMIFHNDKMIIIADQTGKHTGVIRIINNPKFILPKQKCLKFSDIYDPYEYFVNNLDSFLSDELYQITMSLPNRTIVDFRYKNKRLHTTKSKPSMYVRLQTSSASKGNLSLHIGPDNKFKYKKIGHYKSFFVTGKFDLYSEYDGQVNYLDIANKFGKTNYILFIEEPFVYCKNTPVCIQKSNVYFKTLTGDIVEWYRLSQHIQTTTGLKYLSYHNVPEDIIEIALFELSLNKGK